MAIGNSGKIIEYEFLELKVLMIDKLKYKGFTGSLQFSAEDSVFFGKIEMITDLVTFEGKTLSELEEGFQSMVDLHLDDARE